MRLETKVWGLLRRRSVHGPWAQRSIQAEKPPVCLKEDRKMVVFLFFKNNDGLFLNKTLLRLAFIL